MDTIFDGQQEGERILYTIIPHPFSKYCAIAKWVILSILFIVIISIIAGSFPTLTATIRIIGIIVGLILVASGVWWNARVYTQARTYITDRRIMRFDPVSPFYTTKRALFWNEALKAKGYAPNMLYRMMNIGIIQVEPIEREQENVVVTDVYYCNDLANYIDKILYTFKNAPAEIPSIRPFVPKPKGKRY